MKAIIPQKEDKIAKFTEVEIPEINPYEVLIKNKASSVEISLIMIFGQ